MPAPVEAAPSRDIRFAKNVAWSWLGAAVSVLAGFIVSPYVIRKVGHEGYGVWTLVFSLIEYYWLLDLGLRSATVKYSAHYRATGERDKINEILNTGLVYYSLIGVIVLAATAFLSRYAGLFFNISPGSQRIFPALILIVGVSWALGTAFNLFNACLEGFQRFDYLSRIWIVSDGLRSIGSIVLLSMGYGLIALALMVVASQMLAYALSYFSFRRVFPEQRLSPRLARFSEFRKMAGYGIHTFLATIAGRTLNETVPVLIGHFRSGAAVGYFMLPVRLLQYSAQAIASVGVVTGSNAAELAASGDLPAIARLGACVNRYCLTLFMPVAIVLLVYGREVLQVWISPDFAARSAALLPVLTAANAFAVAGQFNSSSILYGLGKHGPYARGLLVEAVLTFAASLIVIPRYGILGAAWTTAVLMSLNRGLWAAWLVARGVGVPFRSYLSSIYSRPLATAAPVFALMVLLKFTVLPVQNWPQLIGAGAIAGLAYFTLSFRLCLEREHRAVAVRSVARRLGFAA